jgi:hypothetical protein
MVRQTAKYPNHANHPELTPWNPVPVRVFGEFRGLQFRCLGTRTIFQAAPDIPMSKNVVPHFVNIPYLDGIRKLLFVGVTLGQSEGVT